MPRALSVGSVIDKNKISSSAVWVILLRIDIVNPNDRNVVETVMVAQNNEDVTYGMDIYKAANFEVRVSQSQNQAPDVSIAMHDELGYITARADEMAGGVFSNVTMMIVNLDRAQRKAEFQETFMILDTSVDKSIITFRLGAENLIQMQFPKHRQMKERCAWRYKGYGCDYSGPMPTCDYSLNGANGCVAHNNSARFRGCPGMVRLNI